ncbi:spike glycoprotein [Rousettus madagascariensis nobecovirus]|nr:spike glycoprotein [Rousettus madagascariensis nobecovirus]
MVVLLFAILSVAVAIDPNRTVCMSGYNTPYLASSLSNVTISDVNLFSRIVPEFDVARTSLVVRQTLYVASVDFTRVLITPPTGRLFNDTTVSFGSGIFVNVHMYRSLSSGTDSEYTYCQEPFGVALGNTFVQEPITIIVVAPGTYGHLTSMVKPTTANVTIAVCSNGTLCRNPVLPRWGTAGKLVVDNALQCHGTVTYFDQKVISFTPSTSRFNMAFLHEDGNVLVYYASIGAALNISSAYKFYPYRRVPAGFNPTAAQFFQVYTRPGGGTLLDRSCQGYNVSWYVSALSKQELLVSYDNQSSIIDATACSGDATSELKCILTTFEPPNGVYSLSNFRTQPASTVRLTSSDGLCNINYTHFIEPPLPFYWKRFQIKRCKFDFNSLVSALPTHDLWCHGISPERLGSMCFGAVTLDSMLINVTHYNDFKANVPDPFTRFNYKLPTNFYGCVHTYYLNDSSLKYVVVNDPHWFQEIRPGGRPDNSGYLATLVSNATSCNGKCLGMIVISLTVASGNTMVCPIGNDTALLPDVCVNYNIYGYQGTGVITNSSAVIPGSKVFSLSAQGDVSLFKYNSNVYALFPCAYAPITAAFYEGYNTSLLFNNLQCDFRSRAINEPTSSFWRTSQNASSAFDTTAGCVYNAIDATNITVSECSLLLGDSYCLRPSRSRSSSSNLLELVLYDPLYDALVPITPVYQIEVPTNFTLAATTEYIQTYASKISIDCSKYLCGDSVQCKNILLQYGTFCNDVNTALTRVFSLLDTALVETVTSLKSTAPADLAYTGDFNFTSLVGCLGTSCNQNSYRSAISDLLFNKVSVADPGFMQAYQKCLDSQWGGNVRDLICTQSFNGISVLPPIVSPSMQALYTTALVGGIAASGFTFGVSSAAVIPFATQLQFRLNGLGVTTNVLMENQKLIANAFNKALVSIQTGFEATNQALNKIQTVVNHNALQLQALVQQLGNTFGAISSSVNEIFSRLDQLEANAEVDRLISGRMVVLNTYVTQLLIQASELRSQAQLANQKMSECVKAQSSRNDFCGNGTHVFSIPQVAPNGMLFIHYSYQPTEYKQLYTTAGLCFNGTGYVPKDGLFVREDNTSTVWYFTKAAFYSPSNLSYDNTRQLDSCGVNYTVVNNSVLTPFEPPNFNFDAEFDKYFKNQSSRFNITFDSSQFNATLLDLSGQMKTLDQVVKELNESFINLKELGVYTQTIKWPWYAWLGMIAGLVGLAMAVVMLCCMTNCCSGFKGICSCRQCQYDDYADVYPAVRVSGKRTV